MTSSKFESWVVNQPIAETAFAIKCIILFSFSALPSLTLVDKPTPFSRCLLICPFTKFKDKLIDNDISSIYRIRCFAKSKTVYDLP